MKALTAAEMREVDRLTTERYGIPSLQLMENAGKHVADAVLREFSPRLPKRVAVLCGKGNNGGDGLVAARLLLGKVAQIRVLLFGAGEELRGDAKTNLQRWRETGNEITRIESEAAWQSAWPEVASADAIVINIAVAGASLARAVTTMSPGVSLPFSRATTFSPRKRRERVLMSTAAWMPARMGLNSRCCARRESNS